MSNENQSSYNFILCNLRHEQLEKLWQEREKQISEKFNTLTKTFEAKAKAEAQALVIKATMDLVSETRMREYINSNTIKRSELIGTVVAVAVVITLILKIIGH